MKKQVVEDPTEHGTITLRFADSFVGSLLLALLQLLLFPVRVAQALFAPAPDPVEAADREAERLIDERDSLRSAANELEASRPRMASRPRTKSEAFRRLAAGEPLMRHQTVTLLGEAERVLAAWAHETGQDLTRYSDTRLLDHLDGTWPIPRWPLVEDIHAKLAAEAGVPSIGRRRPPTPEELNEEPTPRAAM